VRVCGGPGGPPAPPFPANSAPLPCCRMASPPSRVSPSQRRPAACTRGRCLHPQALNCKLDAREHGRTHGQGNGHALSCTPADHGIMSRRLRRRRQCHWQRRVSSFKLRRPRSCGRPREDVVAQTCSPELSWSCCAQEPRSVREPVMVLGKLRNCACDGWALGCQCGGGTSTRTGGKR